MTLHKQPFNFFQNQLKKPLKSKRKENELSRNEEKKKILNMDSILWKLIFRRKLTIFFENVLSRFSEHQISAGDWISCNSIWLSTIENAKNHSPLHFLLFIVCEWLNMLNDFSRLSFLHVLFTSLWINLMIISDWAK